MIEFALIIPIAAICNRFRGGGVVDRDIPARKLVSGVVLATCVTVMYWHVVGNTDILRLLAAFVIILAGWYVRNIIGTGMLFNAIHGWYASKWKGITYGSARGLLTLATTVPLAWVAGNMYLSLWGLLGSLQGVIFYVAGVVSVKASMPAVTLGEVLDGALFGVILFAILHST